MQFETGQVSTVAAGKGNGRKQNTGKQRGRKAPVRGGGADGGMRDEISLIVVLAGAVQIGRAHV